jgi:diguanylate cyclase (GGDEF)-like protein/PAS domain S-box-containing protein
MTNMKRGWLLYILGGTFLLLGWELAPPLKIGLVFNVIAFSSPVVIVIAVRTWRPEHRLPWYLFALGLTLFVAGEVITYNYEKLFGAVLPYPSIGDILYLTAYPCLIAGVLLMVHRRSPGRHREGLIDSLIVAIGIGTISWVFLMSPLARSPEANAIQKLVGMAYPFMDLVLIVVVVRLAIGPGRRAQSFSLMMGAAIALFCTDFVYSYISVQGIVYNQAGYLEAGWASFYLLWGAAALHGSMRTLSDPALEQEHRPTKARLGLLAGATLMVPAVQIIQEIRGERVDAPFVIGSSIALFLLVVVRMAGLIRREELSAARQKALQDAGQALVVATDRDGIHRAAMQSAGRLAGETAAVVLLVNMDGSPPQEFTVVGASHDDGTTLGRAVNLPAVRTWKRADLIALDSIMEPSARRELGGLIPMPDETRFVFVAPLFMLDEMKALLCMGSEAPLSRSTCEALETLSSQAALALESAALTEDLLRRRSEARFSSLVQNSSDVVMVVAADSSMTYVSPSVERVLGHEPAQLTGSKLTEHVHPDEKAKVLQFLTSGDRDGDEPRPALTEFRLLHRDGHWLHVESQRTNLLGDPNVNGIVLNTRDIGERKAFEEQLEHQAFHDRLTELANRALFRDRVEHALERQTRDGRPVSVLFLDLDDFNTINDTLGHALGDQVLKEVAERLMGCLRAADTAARLGGDEFGILLEDGGVGFEAAEVASRLMTALETPIRLGGKTVTVRASIGIATARPGEMGAPKSGEELMRNADVAMYMAMEAGKGRYQLFEPAMHDTALRRLELKADLQRAIDSGEFVLYYQPVIELETGAIIGLEALIRWNHPERGLVPPLEFIPLAEETGLIVPMGGWVIKESCRQAVLLHDRLPVEPPLHMAVNLSARQLQRQEIVGEIGEILAETGLDPGLLILEITESVMMKDVKLSLQRLTELKEIGVKLAVDDFGTGYSSLNYIQQFPVDILKVDKSFVDAVSTDPRKSALTATIIKLASDLELLPVAEGIERADQLEQLLDLHCDLGQGFYFAKPLSMEGVDELLAARRALAHRETELSS